MRSATIHRLRPAAADAVRADEKADGAAKANAAEIAAIEVGFMSKFKAQPENFVNMLDYGAADIEADYLPWRWEQAG